MKPNLFKRPGVKAYSDGAKHKIGAYYRLESLLEMKQALAKG